MGSTVAARRAGITLAATATPSSVTQAITISRRIVAAHAVQEVGQDTTGRKCGGDTDDASHNGERHRMAHDGRGHSTAVGAEGNANANLAGLLDDRPRQHAVRPTALRNSASRPKDTVSVQDGPRHCRKV